MSKIPLKTCSKFLKGNYPFELETPKAQARLFQGGGGGTRKGSTCYYLTGNMALMISYRDTITSEKVKLKSSLRQLEIRLD